MNELISYVNSAERNVLHCVYPCALGVSAGYLADAFTWLLKIQLPISSMQIKSSRLHFLRYIDWRICYPYTLHDGLHETLVKNLSPDPNQQTFYTSSTLRNKAAPVGILLDWRGNYLAQRIKSI